MLRTHQGLFTEKALQNIDLLIIANATAPEQKEGEMKSAFTESEIKALFEYVYIPPCTTITGTRANDFTEPSGYWAEITVSGIDENQNQVSSSDTVVIQ